MRPCPCRLLLLASAVALALPVGSNAEDDAKPRLRLVHANGRALPIMLAPGAAPHTRAAADELADYLEAIGGARPEIVEERPEPVPQQAVWVGYQPALDKLFPGTDFLNWASISKTMIWRPNLGNQGGRMWGLPDVPFQELMDDFRFVAEQVPSACSSTRCSSTGPPWHLTTSSSASSPTIRVLTATPSSTTTSSAATAPPPHR